MFENKSGRRWKEERLWTVREKRKVEGEENKYEREQTKYMQKKTIKINDKCEIF